MRIVIPGGSGPVGTVLAEAFHRDGHDVVVLSRNPRPRPWRVISWDGETTGAWRGAIDGSDVVINLAGRSVNCRYTPANRLAILRSRVLSTRAVGQAIAHAAVRIQGAGAAASLRRAKTRLTIPSHRGR